MTETSAHGKPGRTHVAVEPLFALRDVRLDRGGISILRDVSLDLPQKAIIGIVGPSGAGKTSLLRLLNRLDDPNAGEISYLGQPLPNHAVGALRRRVGFVFQAAAMFSGTVADNLHTAAKLGGPQSLEEAPPLDTVLTAIGLGPEYALREASQLSGGEQQRVSIGRVLMTRPEVLLLDEPTSALDSETSLRLLATIAGLAEERAVSVIMVTHRLSEARHVTTHMVMLEAGRVVETGATKQLFSAPRTARARTYLARRE